MSDLDRLIRLLGEVRAKLGRMPRRPEFLQIASVTTEEIQRATNGCGYAKLVELSGLKFAAQGRRDKQEARLQQFESVKREAESRKIPQPPALARNLLIIPDLHAPYHHPDAMEFLRALDSKCSFDTVVNLGDEIDGHALSFHDHDPDLLSPGHELDAAIKALEPLYKLFPKMLLCESNHGSLVHRRAKHHGLPRHVIKPYREILCAPEGWRWEHEVRLQMANGQRLVAHHAYSGNVLKEAQKRGVCMVFGHHHAKFSIEYWEHYEQLMWAAFGSSLADGDALAAEYGKNFSSRPINGVIVVESGIPRLVPMHKDKHKRWTGKL